MQYFNTFELYIGKIQRYLVLRWFKFYFVVKKEILNEKRLKLKKARNLELGGYIERKREKSSIMKFSCRGKLHSTTWH